MYLSTKNISLLKGIARKLAPKFLGPFAITKVLKEGATYQLDLSEELLKGGINKSFHASLLKPHVPNDDRRFPGRLPSQFPRFGKQPDEWIVGAIINHQGKGISSDFLIEWKAGDCTWAPYWEVAHLMAMERYCELMGTKDPSDLPAKQKSSGHETGAILLSSMGVSDELYKGNMEPRKFIISSPCLVFSTMMTSSPVPPMLNVSAMQLGAFVLPLRDHLLLGMTNTYSWFPPRAFLTTLASGPTPTRLNVTPPTCPT